MAYLHNYKDTKSIKNLNIILDCNDYGLESNYHNNSFIKKYIQNLDKFDKNKEKLNFDNISSIGYIEDIPDSENNYNNYNSINFFINTFEQFFPLNNGDYNDFSNIVIDDVSIIIKKKRKKRNKFYKNIYIKKNGKKIKNIFKRKNNNIDNRRKKILCKFFRILKNKINKILESTGVKKKYRYHILPQKYNFKFINILLKNKNKAGNFQFKRRK